MSGTRRQASLWVAAGLLLAGCAGGVDLADTESGSAGSATAVAGSGHHGSATPPPEPLPRSLRRGESFRSLAVPGGPYAPAAPAGGRDDYHCFLIDPGLAVDRFVVGTDVLPGNSDLVHHAILFTVPPEQVADAVAHDAATPGRGWTCFGGTALPDRTSTAAGSLNAAPWLAAWAPGGGETVFGAGTGKLMERGSLVVLQIHYNLRAVESAAAGADGAASSADSTEVRLRLARRGAELEPLETMLLVAPVELPCLPEESGPLCDRALAVSDLASRFGADAGRTVAGLQLLCDGNLAAPRAGPVQSCDRRVGEDIEIRAVAGHMHLLGSSIKVSLARGGGRPVRERVLLDRPVWDFDDQSATPLGKPVRVSAGETLRVTCRHDAWLRAQLPELAEERPRYVTWGEGTSDEMCLGIVLYTRR